MIRYAKCHPKERHFSKGLCQKCYYRKWYLKHKKAHIERNKAYVREYYKDPQHRKEKNEYMREYMRKYRVDYYKKNRDKINANKRRYYAENPAHRERIKRYNKAYLDGLKSTPEGLAKLRATRAKSRMKQYYKKQGAVK